MYYSDPRFAYRSLKELVADEADIYAKLVKEYSNDVHARSRWYEWQGVAHLVAAAKASWASKMLVLAPEGTGDLSYTDEPTPEMIHWHHVVVSEAFSLLRRFQHIRPESRSTSVSSNLSEDALHALATTIVTEAGPRVRLEVEKDIVERMDREEAERRLAKEKAEQEAAEAALKREAEKREARRQRRLLRKTQE